MVKPSRGRRSPSLSGSSSCSISRSRSRSVLSPSRSLSRFRSFSSSSSPSRSVSSGSRSPPRRGKSRIGPGRRPRSPPSSKGASSPSKKATPIQGSLVLCIDSLSRNVNEGHLKEMFANFGEVIHFEIAMDRPVNLPKGLAYIEFKQELMLRKLGCSLIVTQLIEMLLKQRSHYHLVRKYLHKN